MTLFIPLSDQYDIPSLALLLQDWPHLAICDSMEEGRYSWLSAAPFAKFIMPDIQIAGPQKVSRFLDDIKRVLQYCAMPSHAGYPPFQGGVMGYLGYEMNHISEGVMLPPKRDAYDKLPDACLYAYDWAIIFDHQQGKSWLCSTGLPASHPVQRDRRARKRVGDILSVLQGQVKTDRQHQKFCPDWQVSMSERQFQDAVHKAIEHIRAGDMFQANISCRFDADLPTGFNPVQHYVHLRHHNPAPFGGYFDWGDGCILSCSPERFLRCLPDGQVQTMPIKGTMKRTLGNPEKDKQLLAQLAADPKERAENIMITDLLRNDLSRVCQPGSVQVEDLCVVKSYRHVHHLVSKIGGQLYPHYQSLDLLMSAFPGGSITGAPKIAAMNIIAAQEQRRRKMYCGSMVALGFNGYMDSNILIRSLILAQGKAFFHVGSGITARSKPQAEYQEILLKARGLMDSFD